MKILRSDCLVTALTRDDITRLLPRNAVGVEIGVLGGGYSKKLLENAAPRTLHLVDPWPVDSSDEYNAAYGVKYDAEARYRKVRRTFASEIAGGRVVLDREYSDKAVGLLGCATGGSAWLSPRPPGCWCRSGSSRRWSRSPCK